jgi:hypothetical protein
MAELTGNDILARCLKVQGVKDIFFIMAGAMLDAETACINKGIGPAHATCLGRWAFSEFDRRRYRPSRAA